MLIQIVVIVMLKQQEKARWQVVRFYDDDYDAVDDNDTFNDNAYHNDNTIYVIYKGSSRHRKSRR